MITEIQTLSRYSLAHSDQDFWFRCQYLDINCNVCHFYQLHAQSLYFNAFIAFLYRFRALLCSSSGRQIVLTQNLVSSQPLGDCSVHRLREDSSPLVTSVLNSHLKRVTIPDAVLMQFVLLKISIIVLETCRGM